MILYLTKSLYEEAKKKNWIKTGLEIAKKNIDFRIKKAVTEKLIEEVKNKEYWMVGNLSYTEVQVI